ncbi:MAG: DUF523 domain-containing protein [Candidatus Omnitrophica bacterium]|nr:DUF523 domain-containing protein [Candidatus Omnitrophota bacterium]MBU1924790.1 DUF523 domain-containing protein [Candidatus Omnitrophota bacterium]
MIFVSACLAGENCRHDGKDCSNPLIKKLKEKGKVVAVCPEVSAGLTVPRLPCEIVGEGAGEGVLSGRAQVFNNIRGNLTAELLKGAHAALAAAKKNKVQLAVLKSKSAACGVGKVFDGTFGGKLINGDGILTALLKKEGIHVICEEDFCGI